MAVIFVCRSVEPPELTRHVLQLAALRGTPLCSFNGLEALLAARLRTRHAAAVGIAAAAADTAAEDSAAALAAAVAPLCPATAAPAATAPYTTAAVRRVMPNPARRQRRRREPPQQHDSAAPAPQTEPPAKRAQKTKAP
jgi:hypothetical protein